MKINACSEQIQLDNLEMVIGKITKPVILEIWNGRQKDSVIRREYPYTKVTQTDDGLKAYARIEDEWAGTTEVTDIYRVEEGEVVLSRQVRILKESGYPGIRLRTEISLFPDRKNAFEDLRQLCDIIGGKDPHEEDHKGRDRGDAQGIEKGIPFHYVLPGNKIPLFISYYIPAQKGSVLRPSKIAQSVASYRKDFFGALRFIGKTAKKLPQKTTQSGIQNRDLSLTSRVQCATIK